jgi:hypothetical protein
VPLIDAEIANLLVPIVDGELGALDTIAQAASLRGRPVPRPEVLVCDGPAGPWAGEPHPDLLDRLPDPRLICHLPAPVAVPGAGAGAAPTAPQAALSGPAPSRSRIPTVVRDAADPAWAILAAMAGVGL